MIDDTNSPTKLDNEVKRQLVEEIEKSKLIIGIKPMSTKTIEAEAAAITSSLKPNEKKDRNFIYKSAAVNLVTKFFKNSLKMSEKDRNEINIETIFE